MVRSPLSAALALLAWAIPGAAIDDSTGGLENPLSHLLLFA